MTGANSENEQVNDGEKSLASAPDFSPHPVEVRLHRVNHTYTDQEYDSESGLMYYNARYYDTDLKRFTSFDHWNWGEKLNSQTQNHYSYVINNPMKYVDPTGKTLTGAMESYGKSFRDWFGMNLSRLAGNERLVNKFANESMVNLRKTGGELKQAVTTKWGLIDTAITLAPIGVSGVVVKGMEKEVVKQGLKKEVIEVVASKSTVKSVSSKTFVWRGNAKININDFARKRANGHAWSKHGYEFRKIGITTKKQFRKHIKNVINNPTNVKNLSYGRTAIYDRVSNTLIIYNPKGIDTSTVMRAKIRKFNLLK